MINSLDQCLLKKDEVLKSRAYWESLNDPFPAWNES